MEDKKCYHFYSANRMLLIKTKERPCLRINISLSIPPMTVVTAGNYCLFILGGSSLEEKLKILLVLE